MAYITVKENENIVTLDDAQNLPKTFYDCADADITPEDVRKGKVAYGPNGKIIGTLEVDE